MGHMDPRMEMIKSMGNHRGEEATEWIRYSAETAHTHRGCTLALFLVQFCADRHLVALKAPLWGGTL